MFADFSRECRTVLHENDSPTSTQKLPHEAAVLRWSYTNFTVADARSVFGILAPGMDDLCAKVITSTGYVEAVRTPWKT
jgi:hypothetical protein